MKEDYKISVVIPILDDSEATKEVILSLNQQTFLPSEIVLVDSSAGKEVEEVVKGLESKIPLSYKRIGKAFPYEATNLGAGFANSTWLAFLDVTTLPKESWLADYVKIIGEEKVEVIFGVTQYVAVTGFQKLLRASTYGGVGHETAPGSLIKKTDFIQSGRIIEGVRSGGDIEWRNRLKNSPLKCITPSEVYLTYTALPKSFLPAMKKFFIYQMHGATLNIQNTVKNIYLGLALILSAILIPKWNSLVGWEKSPLYMPNITKIYLSALVVLFLSTLFVNKIVLNKISNSFFSNMLKTLIFLFFTFSIYKWNAVIAGWVEDSVWYIPNITKIYVGAILLASVMYRGLYFPLKNQVEKNYLFPFQWIKVGVLGLLFDLAKSPGYLIGSILIPYKRVNSQKQEKKTNS